MPAVIPAGIIFLCQTLFFSLGLTASELAVYSYLLYCEDRETYQCYPSYRKIGKAVSLSENTVAKCVHGLEDKGLITTEPTKIFAAKGKPRNGTLLYTIRPIQEALDSYNERQMALAESESKMRKRARRLEKSSGTQRATELL